MKNNLQTALHWIIPILNKHKIQYNISGGFSAYLYGAKRPINDIDIEISEDDFEKIFDEVKNYIIFGPEQYKDERWNLKLMTLNYFGQKIDIGGADKQEIFDDDSKKWIHSPTDFSKSKTMFFGGVELSVIDPYELIDYKKLLSGDHQKIDIAAVEIYIQNCDAKTN